MPQAAGCRILAIMGSGETSPTMVTMHRTLVARLETEHPAAVLLETPYWFQENASDVSARAQAYFARSVGLDVTAQPGMRPSAPGDDGGAGTLRAADWVFAGPGSPSTAPGAPVRPDAPGPGTPVRPDAPGPGAPVRPDAAGPAAPACSGQAGDAVLPLPDLIAAAEQRFDAAERDRDAAA